MRVAVGGHRVEVAGDDEARAGGRARPGDDVVADPLDRQVRQAAEPLDHVIGDGGLGVALRGDGDEVGGAGEQIGHGRAVRPAAGTVVATGRGRP